MPKLDVHAYLDESETPGSYSVVAGCCQNLQSWTWFDSEWRRVLATYRVPEYKASDCEGGRHTYKCLTPEDRKQMTSDLIAVFVDAKMHGCASIVDLKAYAPYENQLTKLRSPHLGKRAGEAYFVNVQQVEESCANLLEGQATEETVYVTLDNRDKYIGDIKDLHRSLARSSLPFASRLAPECNFGDSKDFPGIQAADLLAFEVKRHFEGEAERWQFARLRATEALTIQVWDSASISCLVANAERQWGGE
jgi:hypothetical protein